MIHRQPNKSCKETCWNPDIVSVCLRDVCFKIRWPSIALFWQYYHINHFTGGLDFEREAWQNGATWYPTSWVVVAHLRPAMWWCSWKIPRPWHTCGGRGKRSAALVLTSGWLERGMDDVKSTIQSHLRCDGMYIVSFSSPLFQIFDILSLVACWTPGILCAYSLRKDAGPERCFAASGSEKLPVAKILTLLMEHVFMQETVTYLYSIQSFNMNLINSIQYVYIVEFMQWNNLRKLTRTLRVFNCTWIPWWIYYTPTSSLVL